MISARSNFLEQPPHESVCHLAWTSTEGPMTLALQATSVRVSETDARFDAALLQSMCFGDGVALFQSPLPAEATTLFKNAVVDDDVSVPNEKSPEYWTLDQMSGNFNPLSLTSFIKVHITHSPLNIYAWK